MHLTIPSKSHKSITLRSHGAHKIATVWDLGRVITQLLHSFDTFLIGTKGKT